MNDKNNSQDSLVMTINSEINRELADPKAGQALLATVFKGLSGTSMKQAIMEGMIRGFTFKDFLQKDIYAIPFKDGYSLMTSIDKARKIGQKAGQCGKKKPEYVYKKDGIKILSCEVTVQKMVNGYVGDYTAEVYFDEYNKSQNLWLAKPKTMIAKVAEMHALRMAFPEELSKIYIEEELNSEKSRFEVANQESESLKMKNLNATKKEKEPNKKGQDETQESPESDPSIQYE